MILSITKKTNLILETRGSHGRKLLAIPHQRLYFLALCLPKLYNFKRNRASCKIQFFFPISSSISPSFSNSSAFCCLRTCLAVSVELGELRRSGLDRQEQNWKPDEVHAYLSSHIPNYFRSPRYSKQVSSYRLTCRC